MRSANAWRSPASLGIAIAWRAYSTNRCFTAMWSASSSSQASLGASSVMCVSRCVGSNQRRVHLAAEVAMLGQALQEGLHARSRFARFDHDQSRAALRQAFVHRDRQAGLRQQLARSADRQDGLAVAELV